MRFHAVPDLDDRQPSGIVALNQQLARTAPRGVDDAANDGAKEFAQGRCLVRLGLELVYPGDRHELRTGMVNGEQPLVKMRGRRALAQQGLASLECGAFLSPRPQPEAHDAMDALD